MGSGASVLRNDLDEHTTFERYIRLNRPGLPYHNHVIVVTVGRIPEVEVDVHDRVMAGNVQNFGHISDDELSLHSPHSDDYGHVSDYDYDEEEELAEWLRVTRF